MSDKAINRIDGETLPGGEIKREIKREIARRLKYNELDVPMLPHVVHQILVHTSKPNVSFKELTRVVKQDQHISARIIKMANSPVYRGLHEIRSIRRAIVTLGMRTMTDFIFSVSMGAKIFRNPLFEKRMDELWQHSVGCAFVAQQLAYRFRRDIDDAFLQGLLHDIGKPLIIDTISKLIRREPDKFKKNFVRSEFLEDILDEFHCQVGGLIGRKWSFSDQITAAILFHHDPLSHEDAEIRKNALLIGVADLFCHRFGLGVPVSPEDLTRHPWPSAFGLKEGDIRLLEKELAGPSHLFIKNFVAPRQGPKRRDNVDEMARAFVVVHKRGKEVEEKDAAPGIIPRIVRHFKENLWLWLLLALFFALAFFVLTGNNPILPAIYR